MTQPTWLRCGVYLLTVCSLSQSSLADPCGMVPPIVIGQEVAITRTGNQKTYVFFKDGVETVVIRPGFIGSVEEFGMLIPFPAVPALRKVADNVFPHIAAAVDPPEVVVDLRLRFGAVADALPAPGGGGVGEAGEWAGAGGDEGGGVVVCDVALQGAVLGGEFGGPGDGCFPPLVPGVGCGDEVVEW